jgi:serine/threonine protein kinase
MNELFVAEQVKTTRSVVLKIPFPEFSIARTEQEVRAAAKAVDAHPDVVRVDDYGELVPGVPYLQMELVKGSLLSDRLKQRGGRMNQGEAARLGGYIASVMDKVHQVGVIHRDLKPENLMIVPDPAVEGGERIKILDFGIALVIPNQQAGNRRITQIGTVMGTAAYMPPEQWLDTSMVSEKADVFALGSIIYELLGGPLPVTRPLNQVGSRPMMALLTAMTAQRAEERPSMAQAAARLRSMAKSRYSRLPWVYLSAVAVVGIIVGVLLVSIVVATTRPPALMHTPDLSVAPDLQASQDLSSPADQSAPRDHGMARDLATSTMKRPVSK